MQVDSHGRADSVEENAALEFTRNGERFSFLKWGSHAFKNLLIVPPGNGIVHQVNLEYLARSVFVDEDSGVMYPDSVVGTDSHTTMINGLGVVGWGVGGIEAEAVMLGECVSMVLPEVVGFRLVGALPATATATDLVLVCTEMLRKKGVVGKFVEFYGPGVANLSLADRATIANMAPEYGATVGFFAPDKVSLAYLLETGRSAEHVARVEAYLRAQGLLRDYAAEAADAIAYTVVLELDLAAVVPALAGPKRPHDRVPLSAMAQDFAKCLDSPVGFKGYAIAKAEQGKTVEVPLPSGAPGTAALAHGSVLLAAITSCTNTSNPDVMVAAGLLAQKAVAAGLKVSPLCKTSLSPGSGVVQKYLQSAGLLPAFEALGFHVTGYGCMTCIGNSGPLASEALAKAVEDNDIVAAGVLSGNRNFEGRIHASLRANYLASPPLVVAYALAGSVAVDFATQPVGVSSTTGKAVMLSEIWPSRDEIAQVVKQHVQSSMFRGTYGGLESSNPRWNALTTPKAALYPWDPKSTYVKQPPYFDRTERAVPAPVTRISGARALLNLGDSITTDHISPAGNITRQSPAGRWLEAHGVAPADFNTYGARRGHDDVMARGTFANTRLVNKLFGGKAAPKTTHQPSGEAGDIFDVAARYIAENVPTVILAGGDYGSGSSRDWAAKGPFLHGVKVVIAVSYERIHRSNLIGMGIVPLQFKQGQSADSLGLTGKELFDIDLGATLTPGAEATVTTDTGVTFKTTVRFDTPQEINYYVNGGILHYVLRRLAHH